MISLLFNGITSSRLTRRRRPEKKVDLFNTSATRRKELRRQQWCYGRGELLRPQEEQQQLEDPRATSEKRLENVPTHVSRFWLRVLRELSFVEFD